MAEANVNKEPEIIERKGRISELSEEGKALCESVQEKLAELSKWCETKFRAKLDRFDDLLIIILQKQKPAITHLKQH